MVSLCAAGGEASLHCARSCCEQVQERFRPSQQQIDEGVTSRCEPSASDSSLLEQVQVDGLPECTPFYIDEVGDLSFRELESCVVRANDIPRGGLAQYLAHVWPGGAEEHAADWTLLEALRAHPMRSMDPAVALHFTGILGFLSLFTDESCMYQWRPDWNAASTAHHQRMNRAARALEERIDQLAEGQRRVYVLFSTFWNPSAVLGELAPLAESAKGLRHIVVANQDHLWNSGSGHVTIPYVPTFQLDLASHDAHATCDPSRRPYSIFFAGTMIRRGEGANRAGVMAQIAATASNRSFILYYTGMGREGSPYQENAEYAARIRSSRYCLVAEGDTPTSRRLFDAIAGGCVPVYIGDAHALASRERADGQSSLPFPSVVNWSSLVIFAGSLSCLAGSDYTSSRALARQIEELEQQTPPEEFRRQCRARLETFSRYLSFIRPGPTRTTGRWLCDTACLAGAPSWADKCAWPSGQCDECPECHAGGADRCEDWCASHDRPWSERCTWPERTCSGCSECSECSGCSVAATLCPDSCTAASQEVGCDESCWTHEARWEEKCESTFGDGRCSDCPPCRWEARCARSECRRCWQCSEPSSVDGAGAATGLLQELYRSRLADRLSQGNLTCPASPPPLPASPSPLPTATALPPPLLPQQLQQPPPQPPPLLPPQTPHLEPLPPASPPDSSTQPHSTASRSDAGTASPLNSFTAVSSVFVLVALALGFLFRCRAKQLLQQQSHQAEVAAIAETAGTLETLEDADAATAAAGKEATGAGELNHGGSNVELTSAALGAQKDPPRAKKASKQRGIVNVARARAFAKLDESDERA